MTATLEPQPSTLPRFSQLNSAVISAVPCLGLQLVMQSNGCKTMRKIRYHRVITYDFKGEARQLVQEGNALCCNVSYLR